VSRGFSVANEILILFFVESNDDDGEPGLNIFFKENKN